MKKPGVDGTFIACLLLNMFLTAKWSIPVIALFVGHFVFGIPLWWSGVALVVWIAGILFMMYFFGALTSLGNRPTPKPTPEEREAKKRELEAKSRAVGEKWHEQQGK